MSRDTRDAVLRTERHQGDRSTCKRAFVIFTSHRLPQRIFGEYSRRSSALDIFFSMVAPETADTLSSDHRRAPSARLVVADAALQLIERWRSELRILRRRSPTSDSVRTLSDCIQELVEAITAGRELAVRLTLNDAHLISRIPISTLRWLCNHRADAVGATKQEGIWYLDRSQFETYLASPDGQAATPPAPKEPVAAGELGGRGDLRLEAR